MSMEGLRVTTENQNFDWGLLITVNHKNKDNNT